MLFCLSIRIDILNFLLSFIREWKKKYNIEDDEENDTMEYDYKNIWRFRADLSGPGLTGDEYFVMTHPLVTGIAMQIYQERQELLSFIGKVIDRVLMEPKDIFYRGTFWDILVSFNRFAFQRKKIINKRFLCKNIYINNNDSLME